MVSRGGRCLCLVLILTGFLLGTTNGETTMGPTTALLNECITLTPCMNGGTCTDTSLPPGYSCSCVAEFTGPTCEEENECITLTPCVNGGACTESMGSETTDTSDIGYSCSCVAGYTGINCEIDINECLVPSLCDATTSVCVNTVGSFNCMCNTGYQHPSPGTTICVYVDACDDGSHTCDTTTSICVNILGSFTCVCYPGYKLQTGSTTTCDDIDECLSNPCMNGGTCMDLVNRYTCSCPEGFNGTFCEDDIDACDPNPCVNEVNCTNHLMNPGDAYYTCVCMRGWTGRNCSEDIRECNAMPCKNNGTCVDGTDYYECYCLQGFNGANCEIEVAELANPGYSNVLSMELQLVWDFPVQGNDDDINCTAKYRIQGTNKTEDKNVGSTSPGIVTVLEPYTIYEFQLICVNLAGSSEPLDFPPQRTLAGKPSQPQNVRISSIQARQVFVEWDEPADKNGPIDGYFIIARRRHLTYVALSAPGSGTSGTLLALTPYQIYTVSVKVFNLNTPEGNQFSEESPNSDPFTTLQAESSATPVTLTIVSVTVILVLICVIMMFICIRKRKRSQQQGNRSSPIASASFTTTPRLCTHLLPANSPTSSGKQQVDDVYHEYERVCVCGRDSSKSSTRANQGTSQGISLTKTKSTSENDQSHDYENPSFDDKEYTDLDFSQVKNGGDPTKPTSSGKEYTDLDFSKIE